ncbi:Sterol uptake control protein 2 [Fusarium oxysporum f. sp. albedinis]|nr:Sterol uptake control protein 2 [Fusarium oxysporum f. sp. albedinis]
MCGTVTENRGQMQEPGRETVCLVARSFRSSMQDDLSVTFLASTSVVDFKPSLPPTTYGDSLHSYKSHSRHLGTAAPALAPASRDPLLGFPGVSQHCSRNHLPPVNALRKRYYKMMKKVKSDSLSRLGFEPKNLSILQNTLVNWLQLGFEPKNLSILQNAPVHWVRPCLECSALDHSATLTLVDEFAC